MILLKRSQNYSYLFLLGCLFLSQTGIAHSTPIVVGTQQDTERPCLEISIPVSENNYLYNDFVKISADSPDVTIDTWNITTPSIQHYDPQFKRTYEAFTGDVRITVNMTKKDETTGDFNLHLQYYLTSEGTLVNHMLPISFASASINNAHTAAITKKSVPVCKPRIIPTDTKQVRSTERKCPVTWTEYISNTLQSTNSLWLQLLLTLLLGLLMSLTPCIYPMIPITVGILQSQGSKSFSRNLLLSLSYTTGIASTFALMGLAAAFSGQVFGSALSNPYVIAPIVGILLYLAGSMLGFYEMYVPTALQSNSSMQGNSSYLSAFLFGAASGTIASPCLSPGLILLLSIVTTLGSKILGFMLLFAFGIGLSIPLLLIGSFSGSLNMLPRAGMWMVEIKRLFGIMLIGMSFYFLKNIMPLSYLFALAALTCLIGGLFYLKLTSNNRGIWKIINNLFGMGLIASAVMFSTTAYRTARTTSNTDSFWLCDYQEALCLANKETKHLLIDVGAPCCSICDAIDEKIFSQEDVIKQLQTSCVCLKVDGTRTDASTQAVLRDYKIVGFPTIILVNPDNRKVLKTWGPELYAQTGEQFAQEVASL